MADLIGQSLGRYHILEQLGEGGMATVYKAFDTRLEREVAIKIIRRKAFPEEQQDRILKRFEREAKSLARLSHPNILKVLDYGEYEGSPYLVLEYMPGGTLKERLKGGPMDWQEALHILIPITQALAYAHEHNLIHRDVKPSNILLTDKGQPLLSDFGIAKILEAGEAATLTGTGVGVGTPEYMAPEQWTGSVTPQSDIYSLGIVLFEMVTGRKPYTADTPAAILLKQATEPLPRPTEYVSNLPAGVERILLKALTKRPEDRYQSMGDMVRAMESLLSGSAQEVRQPLPQPAQSAHPSGRVTVSRLQTGETTVDDRSDARYFKPEKTAVAPLAPESPGFMRYWPVALVGLVIVIIIMLTQVFKGEAPAVATEAPIATELKAATLTPAIPDEITDDKEVVMRYVPAGEFTMGSAAAGEGPIHQVYLDAYYMDKFEVTNDLYRRCVSMDACERPFISGSPGGLSYYSDEPKFDNFPVTSVNWTMANAYCQWRGARLPTEAEWEKAARGTDGRTYPWGEGIDCSRANYNGCIGDTTQVGSYPGGASPYGIYDLSGNVWEWVADWFSDMYYQSSPFENPLGPDTGQFHVLRGGALNGDGQAVSSTIRFQTLPLFTEHPYFGFRCARSMTLPNP